MDKQIAGLIKQNESIYGSLKAKNLESLGELAIPDSSLTQEETKEFLLKENARLKELVKTSKPPEEPKQPKASKAQETPKEPKASKSKPEPTDSDQEEETFEPPAPKFTTIGNMEDLKRAFFSGEYAQFEELVKASPYKFYNSTYKFASDKDGAPDYSARNLIKGFIRSFDDYRKYFMICFRCMQRLDSDYSITTYTYPSIWIVNAVEPVENIIGSTAEDFELVEVTDSTAITDLLVQMRKMDEDTSGLIGEGYVH